MLRQSLADSRPSAKIKYLGNFGPNLECKERRHRISDLHKLLGSIPEEDVIIRKGLKAGSLPDREAPALGGVWMNEVMAILGYVTCHGAGW